MLIGGHHQFGVLGSCPGGEAYRHEDDMFSSDNPLAEAKQVPLLISP